jgi:hypothetical protein
MSAMVARTHSRVPSRKTRLDHFRGTTKLITYAMGRAFSPLEIARSRFLGRCPRLVWLRVFGPHIPPALSLSDVSAPTARFHFGNCSIQRCPRLVWLRVFGSHIPSALSLSDVSAPAARFHFGNCPIQRCPRLVWLRVFGPHIPPALSLPGVSAPTARFHTSPGQRPGYVKPTRIEG